MARALLSNTCELARQILDGEHDQNLEYIQQAVQSRKKNLFRRGSRVKIVGGSLHGKTGVVLKVNPTRVSVGIGDLLKEDEGTAWEHTYYSEGEWNVPPRMLEVL